MRKPYPDELTNIEWMRIETILEEVKKLKGRPPIDSRREILKIK